MAFDYAELQAQLAVRQQQALLRQRYTVDSPQGVRVKVAGHEYINFCSNDYLGLANHPEVKAAALSSIQRDGVGGGASHLVCGHHQQHHLLEQEFASLTGRDAALLFSSGYMANLGVLTALCDKQDAIFEDKLNHASLIDGGLQSGARFQRFLHNDMQSLEQKLVKTSARRKLICVDGVFSMDGDKAPLRELVKLAPKHDALLMVDDAHGFGVLGANGFGLAEEASVDQQQLPLLMCTLGKSLGGFGALVAGPKVLIDYLIQFARSYIYTTSMPPSIAAACRRSLSLLSEEAWRRQQLLQNIDAFKQQASALGLSLLTSDTAIQPIWVGDEQLALDCQAFLRQQGIWLSAIRTPTVAKGAARLRVTLTAAHDEADIAALLQSLEAMIKRYPQLLEQA